MFSSKGQRTYDRKVLWVFRSILFKRHVARGARDVEGDAGCGNARDTYLEAKDTFHFINYCTDWLKSLQ